jgi:hypothetical protein
MALVKSILKSSVKAAFLKAKNDKTDSALDALCEDLSTAIDAYIKSATVVGTCTTPSGAGTTLSTSIT